jgi:hypothetical protein
MQPEGHVVTWEEFRTAFRAHHIPEGLIERKLNEFLALPQGTHTVMQYAQDFNHLCQYAGCHANTDAKKRDHFHRGLNTKLKERLNLVRVDTFNELVNMAITQEDCISALWAEKKRKIPTGPSSVRPPRYRLVQNTATRAPPWNNQPGRWVARPPQQSIFNRPPVPQPQQQQQQQGLRANFPQFNQGNNNNHCFNCGSSSHFIRNCPQPRKSFQGKTYNPSSKGKKQVVQVRQGRVNFTTLSELLEGAPIMTGTFTIHHQPAVILFDSGATHSFINLKFGTKVGLDYYPTPGGKIVSNQICRNVPIQMGSNLVKIDLLVLDLEGMDILLGMDWMTRHRVSLDISSRAVEIDSPYQGTIVLYLSHGSASTLVPML